MLNILLDSNLDPELDNLVPDSESWTFLLSGEGITSELAIFLPENPASGFYLPTINFDWGDANGTIYQLPANKVLIALSLAISIPFNGVGASLAVGTIGTPQLFMAVNQNSPDRIGSYIVMPNYLSGTSTNIFLSIVPGSGATQGHGTIALILG